MKQNWLVEGVYSNRCDVGVTHAHSTPEIPPCCTVSVAYLHSGIHSRLETQSLI